MTRDELLQVCLDISTEALNVYDIIETHGADGVFADEADSVAPLRLNANVSKLNGVLRDQAREILLDLGVSPEYLG